MKDLAKEYEQYTEMEKGFCDGFEGAGYSREEGRAFSRAIFDFMEKRVKDGHLPGVTVTDEEIIADLKRAMADFKEDPRENLSSAELIRKILQRYE